MIISRVVIVACMIGFVASVVFAQSLSQQQQLDYQMLNKWRKEIVQLQYTDFCASVKPPPKALFEAIDRGVALQDEGAKKTKEWLDKIMEQYVSKGCGDA